MSRIKADLTDTVRQKTHEMLGSDWRPKPVASQARLPGVARVSTSTDGQLHLEVNNVLEDIKGEIRRLTTAGKKDLQFGENPLPAILKATTLPSVAKRLRALKDKLESQGDELLLSSRTHAHVGATGGGGGDGSFAGGYTAQPAGGFAGTLTGGFTTTAGLHDNWNADPQGSDLQKFLSAKPRRLKDEIADDIHPRIVLISQDMPVPPMLLAAVRDNHATPALSHACPHTRPPARPPARAHAHAHAHAHANANPHTRVHTRVCAPAHL